MNNFYPTYKSKLEPWIKFWILKGNKIAPKVLSEVIEGTTPITIEGVYKGTSLQDLIFKGQTVQNGTPSPEAPIPVQVVKEDNYININEDSFRVDLGGKNIFNKNDVENDKRLDSSGQPTSSSASGFSLTNYIRVQPNTTYTYSRNTTSSTYYVNISEYTSDKTHIQRLYKAGDTTTYTFTTPNNCYFLRINDATTNLYSIQLEEGSQATPYSPYTEHPIELCKIGDYQDRIYNDSGKWYIEKNIGKVVLNGSESWSLQRSGTANWYYRLTSAVTNFNYDNDRSNYLSNITTKASIGTSTTVVGMFLTSAGELRIRNTTEDTIANWEAFLGTTNMLLYYPLLTPTYTEITETTLLSQLEAIKNETLISGTNEITQLPSDLPFILNFKYYMKG